MYYTFKNKKISSMLALLPEKESLFDDEVGNYDFPEKQTMRLKKVMGYDKHRLSKESSTASDFCVFGMNHLFEKGIIKKDEIGAVIVVTLSPDYFLPHISNIVHGKCELPRDVLCMDIPQGCCGFLMGLMQSFLLLETMKDKKVVLFNSDVLSHKVSKKDRNDFPLIGDITTVTIVEHCESAKDINFELLMNGQGRETLIIPAGGFARPCDETTSVLIDQGDGNKRSLEHLHMDGTSVFNFVQTEVPVLIDDIFSKSDVSKNDIDYYLFHQPNKFMLMKLAEKMDVPYEKMFMNIVEKYGNPSGASIPVVTIHNLKNELINTSFKCCLSAFGSGLAWGAMIMELGNLDYCDMIVTDL